MNLKVGLIGFGVLTAWMILGGSSSTQTTGGKKDELAKAHQQVQQLQKSLKDRESKITTLQQRVSSLEGDLKKMRGPGERSAAQLQKDLDKANQTLKDRDQMIATLQQDAPKATADLSKDVEKLRRSVRELELVKKAPLVHSMILRLKKDSDDDEVQAVNEEAGKTLAKIKGVRGLWVGKPAGSMSTESTEKMFHLGVVVLMDDTDTLQKFLEDPLYKQFSEKLTERWQPLTVYDIQRDMDAPKKDEDKKKNPE